MPFRLRVYAFHSASVAGTGLNKWNESFARSSPFFSVVGDEDGDPAGSDSDTLSFLLGPGAGEGDRERDLLVGELLVGEGWDIAPSACYRD